MELVNESKQMQLQDTSEDIVIVGSDVCSLYEAALVYLLLVSGKEYLRKSGLEKRIPVVG